jgi:DNA primase large subunit
MYTTAFRGIAKWRLANRVVTDGRVTINHLDFARINEEVIRERVYEKTLKHFSPSDLPLRGKEAVERIRDSWAKMNFAYSKKTDIGQGATPPCIGILKKRIESGQNLSHIERLALATYLISTNKGVDEILQLFASSPDFDIKVARYQIEHLAGLRGSKKKYTPPNCDAMRKFSLCFPDSGCYNLRNPIQYKGVPK